jgi:hypothetical protein
MMSQRQIIFLTIALMFLTVPSFAESKWLKDLGNLAESHMQSAKNVSLGDTKIGEGLKEALKVGIDNAINATGKTDGYYTNELIKIAMPPKLQMIEKPLRVVGFGKQIDDFVLSMNRAAEKAAPSAKDIFLDAIFNVNIADVQSLYKGGPSAATDFLKKKTYNKLRSKFAPIVTKALAENNVTKKYQDIIGRYQQIPFAQKYPAPSIEEYVVDKSLDGLFVVLGQEEAKIRQDPAARTTSLLKEIFK